MLKPSRLFASRHRLHKTKKSRSYPAGMYWKWHFSGTHSHPINVGEVEDGIYTHIGLQNLFSFPPGLYKRLLRFPVTTFFLPFRPLRFVQFYRLDPIKWHADCRKLLFSDEYMYMGIARVVPLIIIYHVSTCECMSTIPFPLIDTHTSCIVSCALLPRNAIL